MVSINYGSGRLGNNMIQYAAAYIFAKKHNLNLTTRPLNSELTSPFTASTINQETVTSENYNNWGEYFGFKNLLNGISGVNGDVIEINDGNLMEYLKKDSIDIKHYYFNEYLQIKEFLHEYEEEIKGIFSLKYDNSIKKDEVFVVYRIGDIENKRMMLPKEYYEEALELIKPSGGYITSDLIEYPFVKELSEKYNLKLYLEPNPLKVIDFAKNFNNIVLSEGTFSWWIGFLSRAENVIYNKRVFRWHGKDIFCFDRWKSLSWDYDEKYVGKEYSLLEYKPINLRHNSETIEPNNNDYKFIKTSNVYKEFPESQIVDIYNNKIKKPASYFNRRSYLTESDKVFLSNVFGSDWARKDFPRVIALLDFKDWVDKYNIHPNNLYCTCNEDPELNIVKYDHIKQIAYAENTGDLHNFTTHNRCDFFLFNQTIEHLYNPFLAVKNIYDCMKPGAYIFTSVPTINIPHSTPIHFNGYNPMGLAMLFMSCGFEVVENGQWGNFNYLQRLFYYHSWPGYKDIEYDITNQERNVCQCWILCRKPGGDLKVN